MVCEVLAYRNCFRGNQHLFQGAVLGDEEQSAGLLHGCSSQQLCEDCHAFLLPSCCAGDLTSDAALGLKKPIYFLKKV